MNELTKLEAAIIAASRAVDSRGLKIILFSPPRSSENFHLWDFNRFGSAALSQIHNLTDGIPLFVGLCGQKAAHRNHAKNIQLLLDIYKAWIEEGPL